uniref:Uncharacterized protein LOC114326966 n=1 Tax=Diabrotica virgifera virgifera TaxID=50390 RepID=A0A6P7F6Z1_DIAVI
MGNCCSGDLDSTYDGPTRSTRSSSPPSNVITTPPTLNLSNNRAPIRSKSASEKASISGKASTDRASIPPKAITDNTTRTPGCGATTSSKTNRERSRTKRDNSKIPASSRGHSSSSRTTNQHSKKKSLCAGFSDNACIVCLHCGIEAVFRLCGIF